MIDIGAGLAIDGATAEMVVVDRAQLDTEFGASDNPCDRAVAALVTGNPELATTELLSATPSLRRDSLLGEVARHQGDPQTAVNLLQAVLETYQPQGLRLAAVLQHLAKAEHASGSSRDVVSHLTEALALRRTHAAPQDQIASTELMLSIAATTVVKP